MKLDLAGLRAEIPNAVAACRTNHGSALGWLAQRFAVDEETMGRMLAAELGLDFIDTLQVETFQLRSDLIEPKQGLKRGVLHGAFADTEQLMLSNPLDESAIQWAQQKIGRRLSFAVAAQTSIERLVDSKETDSPSHARRSGTQSPRPDNKGRTSAVIDFVDQVLANGWNAQASDIHLEATREGIVVKFRIDGVLLEQGGYATGLPQEEIVSRIKVMADLDIAERRIPQDGRFSLVFGDLPVDCRISIMPSAHGEDVVVRILDKRHLLSDTSALTLAGLGFDAALSSAIRDLALKPHGMLLVTGPTGSGKTTTLYALLSEIRSGREKVVTIEDPIEYELPGVLQVPVNEKKGLTFARGLRSILRHDPDLIMVGEIRDRETAEIAIQSALTGHVVLTTVHANNAIDVVSRFTHMGVDLYALVSSLNGVLAQRLLRLICPHCALSSGPPRRGAGCERCQGTGYLGRRAIGEVLTLDDGLRDLLLARKTVSTVTEYVLRHQTQTLQSEARDLIAQGMTDEAEVKRVVGL